MTAASQETTIVYDQGAAPAGMGGTSPLYSAGLHTMKVVTGTITFKTHYKITEGEGIADIFAQFSSLKGIHVQHPLGVSSGTGKLVGVDYTNKKLLLYAMTGSEVSDDTDQSGAAGLKFIAWGF